VVTDGDLNIMRARVCKSEKAEYQETVNELNSNRQSQDSAEGNHSKESFDRIIGYSGFVTLNKGQEALDCDSTIHAASQ
jgi:hypothetical protein